MGNIREALDKILQEENEEMSFDNFIDKAEVLLVDNAFDFDINKWEKENQEEIDEELCDDDWTQEDEEDFNTYDEESITPKQEQFYEEVRDALQSLIDDEDKENENKELDEDFVSNKELKKHFFRHCLANDRSKVSTRKVVYYDFNNIQEYSEYENELNKNFQSNSDTIILSDPYNIEEVNDAFLQLFKNNTYIIFGWEWNLTNNIGIVQLRVHSFASNVTTNYKANDTLDIIIRTPRNKSITLYAIDLSRMKNKIFNILKKYSNLPLVKSQDSNKLLDNLQSKGNNINNYNNSAMSEDLEETSPYTNIKSNGIYSLNTGWVKHPVQQDIPDIDMDEFEKEFKVWEDRYFDLVDRVESNTKGGRLIDGSLIEDLIAKASRRGQTSLKKALVELAKIVLPDTAIDENLTWCVHHIDCNENNNNIENLSIIPLGNHTKLHTSIRNNEIKDIHKVDDYAKDYNIVLVGPALAKIISDSKSCKDGDIIKESLKTSLNENTLKTDIDNLIEDIYNLRKEGMEEDGEYSIKNLIFKEFRNLGYLDNLKELRKKEISKELSLEQLNYMN